MDLVLHYDWPRIIPDFDRTWAKKSQIINKTINAEREAQRDRERPAISYVMTQLQIHFYLSKKM